MIPAGRHSLVPSAYVLLRRGNGVLLQRRANTEYRNGWYCLPAGHVEPGEQAHIAAAREAKEEVGVTIDSADLQLVHVLQRVADEGGYERIDLIFAANKWKGEPQNMEPEKCDDLRWFDLDKLPDQIIPNVRVMLDCIKTGVFFSAGNYGPKPPK